MTAERKKLTSSTKSRVSVQIGCLLMVSTVLLRMKAFIIRDRDMVNEHRGNGEQGIISETASVVAGDCQKKEGLAAASHLIRASLRDCQLSHPDRRVECLLQGLRYWI